MNYLDLTNRVLDRLREERASSGTLDSDPYFRSIGAHINDAKEQVENAWQWSMLRQDEAVAIVPGQNTVELPNSYDNNYVIKRITLTDIDGNYGGFLKWISDDRMWYYTVGAPDRNKPSVYATGTPAANGNQTINILQPSDDDYFLIINSWHNQDPLTAADDLLKVPSLPVYSLATALASRERGETGAINTGELFAIAQSHLSDAIAYDSARYPEELDWYAQDRLFNTNVRRA